MQVLLPHGTAALSSAGDAELHHRGCCRRQIAVVGQIARGAGLLTADEWPAVADMMADRVARQVDDHGYDKVVFWKLSHRPAGRTIGAGVAADVH